MGMIEEYTTELIEKAQQIIHNNFENDFENTTAYYLQEAEGEWILISEKGSKLCVMFDTEDCQMCGLQPINYVQENGEKL